MSNTVNPNILNNKISILIYIVTIFVGQLFILPFGRTIVLLYAMAGLLTVTYFPMLIVDKLCSKFLGISPNPKQRRISFLIFLLAEVSLGAIALYYNR